MSFADQACNDVPLPNITCHPATWYWAALEANGPLPALTRAANIGSLRGGSQFDMLELPRAGAWNFDTQGMPGLGVVMLWTAGSSHSAVVTVKGISGYNQSCVAAVPHNNHTFVRPADLKPTARTCFLILPQTILGAAARLRL